MQSPSDERCASFSSGTAVIKLDPVQLGNGSKRQIESKKQDEENMDEGDRRWGGPMNSRHIGTSRRAEAS